MILGIDLGTSSVKAVVFDPETGTTRAVAGQEYPIHNPAPDRAEPNPAEWWQAVVDVVRHVTAVCRDLSALAHTVVKGIRAIDPGRDITVETSGDPSCHCDPELTRRIIENLVSNAVKHTPSPGRVRVSISGSRERAYISVSDEGLGVPREKRSQP